MDVCISPHVRDYSPYGLVWDRNTSKASKTTGLHSTTGSPIPRRMRKWTINPFHGPVRNDPTIGRRAPCFVYLIQRPIMETRPSQGAMRFRRHTTIGTRRWRLCVRICRTAPTSVRHRQITRGYKTASLGPHIPRPRTYHCLLTNSQQHLTRTSQACDYNATRLSNS